MRRLLSRLEPLAPYRVQAAIGLLAVAIVAATGGVLLARDSDEQKGAALPEAGVETKGERDTSFLARIVPPPADRSGAADPRVPRTVGDLVRRLPAERKVAQLFLVGFEGKDLLSPVFRQLRRLDLGGIVVDRRNYAGPQTLGSLAGEARVIAADERHVPPWVMAPQEGGEFSVFRDLPPAGSPADIASPADAGRTASVAGKTLRELGVTGVLAPVIDVGLETDPALGARVFSDNPGRVANYAVQSVTAYDRQRMFSAVKHFPGLGTASQPTEEGPAQVGLSDVELRGPRPSPLPGGLPRRSAGGGALPRPLHRGRLHDPRLAVAQDRHRPVARQAQVPRRGHHRRPRRPGHHRAGIGARRRRQGGPGRAPTCCGSRARPATSRRPTSRCCAR